MFSTVLIEFRGTAEYFLVTKSDIELGLELLTLTLFYTLLVLIVSQG